MEQPDFKEKCGIQSSPFDDGQMGGAPYCGMLQYGLPIQSSSSAVLID
jgi:hypothetical protein